MDTACHRALGFLAFEPKKVTRVMTHIGYCSIFLIFFSLSLAQDKVTLNSFTSFDCSGGQTREVTFDNDWGKCQEAIEGRYECSLFLISFRSTRRPIPSYCLWRQSNQDWPLYKCWMLLLWKGWVSKNWTLLWPWHYSWFWLQQLCLFLCLLPTSVCSCSAVRSVSPHLFLGFPELALLHLGKPAVKRSTIIIVTLSFQ